ncbi:MAG: glycosyl hydrolase family 5 [Epsilonproteobacteria bacterium]|nr:MAG: glycosyl hydrolase family 5 [Campylobacterota bacterium]RLA64261.1 MAG: glycosyl hydrolase family 5 [Campylobacterota bacterium]
MLRFIITFLIFINAPFAYSADGVNEISIGSKEYQGRRDFIFRDSLGREAYFRGYNVSGAVKLKSMGFRPFKNVSDAKKSLELLRKKTGSNLIRYTISWEGAQLDIDTIDQKYLKDITAQIKVAIKNKIYILLDYHQDLFSRYLFHKDSKFTGNGAPKFIIEGSKYPKEKCFLCISWSVANKLNKTIMLAFQNFWNNVEINTSKGKRKIQGEFLWQMEKVLTHLKKNLSPKEWDFILGLDPFNEPVDGGIEELSYVEWNEKKLYAFYEKVRTSMDKSGWGKKILFAEPNVFWNTSAPFVHANNPVYPGLNIKNLSFNAHYYDAARMSVSLSGVKNGAYIANLDHIKNTARKISIPPFLSEFGMWIEKGRVKNQDLIINATYQGMEISKEIDSNFVEFYSPLVSGTQWHWDWYHNNHHESLNQTDRLITKGDAWNHENFSVITDFGKSYTNQNKNIVERAYPRKCQGDIMHFFYNTNFKGYKDKEINWGELKFGDETFLDGKENFAFLVWKGSKSIAPTEIFIPPHFKPQSFLVTDTVIKRLDESSESVSLRKDFLGNIGDVGHVVEITHPFPDDNFHFALIISSPIDVPSRNELKKLQTKIKETIENGKSPIFLQGKVKVDKVHIGKEKIQFEKIKGADY